eukprot:scaffold66739_cov32-Tisochrysis_lutea.AAC.4
MLLVLLDLVLDDVRTWSAAFLYVDLVFLSFFSLEHCVRFYAYGPSFMCVLLKRDGAALCAWAVNSNLYAFHRTAALCNRHVA